MRKETSVKLRMLRIGDVMWSTGILAREVLEILTHCGVASGLSVAHRQPETIIPGSDSPHSRVFGFPRMAHRQILAAKMAIF